MPDLPALVSDGKIRADEVERTGDLDWAVALRDGEPARLAAAAITAGLKRAAAARDPLLGLLARDDLAGRAAAWALAQLDAEEPVLAAIRSGKIDARDNGYWSLAIRAASGRASGGLAAAVTTLVAAELERARSGATGLGDRACRVLAILGAKGTDPLIQQALDADRFADRFELQRLRKAVQDGGRDHESIAELSAPWRTLFADHLAVAQPPAPAPTAAKPPVAPPAPVKPALPPGGAVKAPPKALPPPPPPSDDGAGLEDDAALAEDGAPPSDAKPVDWKAFLASPEAEALPAPAKGLIAQLGPVLEQLAARAINAPLTDLSGQEFAGLLLQVLPQALPPQHVQTALSPPALHGYQALAKFLARTGGATRGDDLLAAVKLVRQQLQQQIRQAGILGGPDYSDPDDVPAPAAR